MGALIANEIFNFICVLLLICYYGMVILLINKNVIRTGGR